MDLAGVIAFAGLIAGQFTAVIAVHALRWDDEAARVAEASPRRNEAEAARQDGASTVNAPGMTV